ncbi:hypothetical protein HNE_2863 [Hyphomonas neptunium ATCC 15444]|uniref:Uncharacterized protein n=1 Tax=Hyphomonas neptunium (strain ATCC 15444) TaxID=228405 RepID=Q0BYA2_HYPNA|nr:hypothetical protein HNE_2863 [Hyphomonas neptunium ATCC 15444]
MKSRRLRRPADALARACPYKEAQRDQRDQNRQPPISQHRGKRITLITAHQIGKLRIPIGWQKSPREYRQKRQRDQDGPPCAGKPRAPGSVQRFKRNILLFRRIDQTWQVDDIPHDFLPVVPDLFAQSAAQAFHPVLKVEKNAAVFQARQVAFVKTLQIHRQKCRLKIAEPRAGIARLAQLLVLLDEAINLIDGALLGVGLFAGQHDVPVELRFHPAQAAVGRRNLKICERIHNGIERIVFAHEPPLSGQVRQFMLLHDSWVLSTMSAMSKHQPSQQLAGTKKARSRRAAPGLLKSVPH